MSFLKRVGFLAVMAVSTLGLISGASGVEARQATTYTVEIENLTKGQPFTPPLLVNHTSGIDLFEAGDAASMEVLEIAENGNLGPMVELVGDASAVLGWVMGDGPVRPGQTVRMTIEAEPGSYLSRTRC